jgi:hypothetical protein
VGPTVDEGFQLQLERLVFFNRHRLATVFQLLWLTTPTKITLLTVSTLIFLYSTRENFKDAEDGHIPRLPSVCKGDRLADASTKYQYSRCGIHVNMGASFAHFSLPKSLPDISHTPDNELEERMGLPRSRRATIE